jgi:hypothetical protein
MIDMYHCITIISRISFAVFLIKKDSEPGSRNHFFGSLKQAQYRLGMLGKRTAGSAPHLLTSPFFGKNAQSIVMQ